MKRLSLVLGFVLLSIIQLGVTSPYPGRECVLPRSQKINWGKVRGMWYEGMNTNSPLEKLLRCGSWKHIYPTKNGFKANIRDDHLRTHTYSNLPMTIKITKSGRAYWTKPNAKAWFTALKQDSPNHRINKKLIRVMKAMQQNGVSFFTDYKTYLISLSCGLNGEKYIWANTHTPYPTAESMISIFNKLIKIGWNDVPLHLSECAKNPGVKYYTKA